MAAKRIPQFTPPPVGKKPAHVLDTVKKGNDPFDSWIPYLHRYLRNPPPALRERYIWDPMKNMSPMERVVYIQEEVHELAANRARDAKREGHITLDDLIHVIKEDPDLLFVFTHAGVSDVG